MKPIHLFSTVTRYDKSENRFTSSLVYLIEHLWRHSEGDNVQRRGVCAFLNRLCDKCDREVFAIGDEIALGMQRTERTDENKKKIVLDFEIRSNSILVWVEVKDTAPLNQSLSNYKRDLIRAAKDHCDHRLVLLRHHFVDEKQKKGVDRDVTWDELYLLLKELLSCFSGGSTSSYLINEFLCHLQDKGVLVVSRINRECADWLADFIGLVRLVKGEAENLFKSRGYNYKVSETETGTDEEIEYIGFYLDKGNEKKRGYSVELWASTPPTITMSTKATPKDDDWSVWTERELIGVLELNSVDEQRREVATLLTAMYDELQINRKGKQQRPSEER